MKQHLAALRMLFDWLVTGQVLQVNPAHAVRGPKYVVKKGKTPVLNVDEARALLDSIPVVVKTADPDGQVRESADLAGLRDRALIGLMVYTFARVSAVIRMKVSDYFVQGRRGCHHTPWKNSSTPTSPPQASTPAILISHSFKRRPDTPAFSAAKRSGNKMPIASSSGNHTFRATGITAYLKTGGKLEIAQQIAKLGNVTIPTRILAVKWRFWTVL